VSVAAVFLASSASHRSTWHNSRWSSRAVANAGLLLPATLAERLGIEAVVDQLVDLGDRPGHHRPGERS
jgi:hypothetical protein